MRHIYKTIARLECLNLNVQFSVKKSNLSSFHQRAFCNQTLVPETADMGKDKVPYQLKTPKGTKDCTHSSKMTGASAINISTRGR